MNPSDITPEIIATKIFGFIRRNLDTWETPDKYCNFCFKYENKLPTFKEPEWTGPFLAKAAQIGDFEYVYISGFEEPHEFGFRRSKFKRHKELNYAIAGAILEAMGE